MNPGKLYWIGCLVFFVSSVAAEPAKSEALTQTELIAAGEVLYRTGKGIDGEPITALVQLDVPISGTQMVCRNCHGISGMGTIEGGEIPAAVAGPILFAPEPQRQRPAYNEITFARSIRTGVDAAGRALDPLMPRFVLADQDVKALSAYLRQLGATPSPGVADDSVRIATVLGPDVELDVEQAVLEVFEKYIGDRNRMAHQRLRGGRFPDQWKEVLRSWEFDVWRLQGPNHTWPAQLKAYQQQRPVFALVGGLAAQSWQPIHDFCESERMPCLLPDINLPPEIIAGDYSFYFSRGLALEADIIAKAVVSEIQQANVLVLISDETNKQSHAMVDRLEQSLVARGARLRTLTLGAEKSSAALTQALALNPDAVAVLVDATHVKKLASTLARDAGNSRLYFSATLLDNLPETIPENLRDRSWLVNLTALPNESDSALTRFRIWARSMEIRQERHQALAYFACVAFTENYKHIQQYIMRGYFLDRLEHSSSLTSYLPLYTRGAITPGQRVLSRGGYLIDLSGSLDPEWVLP